MELVRLLLDLELMGIGILLLELHLMRLRIEEVSLVAIIFVNFLKG